VAVSERQDRHGLDFIGEITKHRLLNSQSTMSIIN